MTTVNLTPALPATPTGLAVTGSVGGATLTWNITSPTDTYEVWYNTANTLTGATKRVAIQANHFVVSNLDATVSYWFWVRSVNQYGVVGAYTASASLIQQSLQYPLLPTTANVSAGTYSSSFSTSSGAGIAMNTVFDALTLSITSVPSNSTFTLSGAICYSISNVSVVTGQTLEVIAGVSVYDSTTSSYVTGAGSQTYPYINVDGTGYGNLTGAENINWTGSCGLNGSLIAGHQYTVALWMEAYQATGTPTCSLDVNYTIAVSTDAVYS